MAVMTRRERMRAVFEGRTPDRAPVKLWGAAPGQELLHPDYEPVRDAAVATSDLFVGAGSAFHLYCGRHAGQLVRHEVRPTDSPLWVERVTTIDTPQGELRSIFTESTEKKPGYEKEYLLKEPADIGRLMSIPYEPFDFSDENWRETDRRLGDAGIPCFSLDHAMYGLQRLIGSENFALWSVDEPAPMEEAMAVFARRIQDHARAALAAGVSGVFGWVGPELCTPPLMSPQAFDRYVGALDKPLIDLLHDGGARVWVHCHGKMGPVLERFADMGVDVLNPLEPPPMGDMTLGEAFRRVGDRMGLEGNFQLHDAIVCDEDHVREIVREAVAYGRGRRHILCTCSGYMENPFPEPRYIRNLLAYLDEGVRQDDG